MSLETVIGLEVHVQLATQNTSRRLSVRRGPKIPRRQNLFKIWSIGVPARVPGSS